METTVALRSFEKTDWYGFAGAEDFKNGDAPLIGSVKIQDGVEFVVIVDGQGVEVSRMKEDCFVTGFTFRAEIRSEKMARELLALLPAPWTATHFWNLVG